MFFSHEKISINLIKYFIDFLCELFFSKFFLLVNCILNDNFFNEIEQKAQTE